MILWPLTVFFFLVFLVVLSMVVVSHFLGGRHEDRRTGEPYESGIIPTGSARRRVPVKYYLVAVAFVVFDLESAYIFAWAVSFRKLGWQGYVEAIIFIGILFAALVYFWRIGGLDWGKSSRHSNGRIENRPNPAGQEKER